MGKIKYSKEIKEKAILLYSLWKKKIVKFFLTIFIKIQLFF